MRDVTPQRLTAVPGLSVGHWTDSGGATGCTVILGPPDGMRAAAALRGRATGTREVDALDPRHLVERIHAILLTGGSAYGLGAPDVVAGHAVGDGRDARGEIPAGARKADGGFLDGIRSLAEGGTPLGEAARTNTPLAVVATNADLTRTQLQALANAGGDALARRIVPFGTMLDGDIVFAVSTAAVPAATPMQAEALAALVVPEAVERAVRQARGSPGVPGLGDGR